MSHYFEKPPYEELNDRMGRIEGSLDDLHERMGRIDKAIHKILDHLGVDSQDQHARAVRTNLTTTDTEAPHARQATLAKDALSLSNPVTINGPYPYTTLEPTKSQIRILELYYDISFTDPIRASLKIISLDEPKVSAIKHSKPAASAFTALSYCWGTPIKDHTINLDGYQLPITQSLDSALRHLRNFYMDGISVWEKYLWIDQLCINQSDVDERSSQVSLMRRIYKKAHNVHVWLGDESDTSHTAIDLLTILGAPPKDAPGEAIHYPSLTEPEVALKWKALASFFGRPWFERVWIRQEIALHDKVLLSCGEKVFDIGILERALLMVKYVKGLGYGNPTMNEGITSEAAATLPWDYHPWKLLELRTATGCGSNWVRLGTLLLDARGCKATDARDMVFSVIGLADPNVFRFVPDYRSDVRNIYITATKEVLRQKWGLHILSACQNPERKHGLPSWVPNSADAWRCLPFKPIEDMGSDQEPPFKSDVVLTADIQVRDEILILRGGLIDEISHVSPETVDSTSATAEIEDVYESWLDLVEKVASSSDLPHRLDLEVYRQDTTRDGLEARKAWIRLLSVLLDQAEDLDGFNVDRPSKQTLNMRITSV
ncbi:uncharacterized protein N0V89_011756 [Didymosphaeria variabile]|uniref:Heterokaryon incompatibility domain-containing protein n=1 Tax=Didymosphaeria variabile TaxID=1932322 RepID=A0A9W8XAC1_9PLEO|nr:uncharacterized protein N0V89_011756 [Didymosphaeria variabile]KAJ4345622.1 hypothetical protein N0V89_011756 [Didymosphaeria variabile]